MSMIVRVINYKSGREQLIPDQHPKLAVNLGSYHAVPCPRHIQEARPAVHQNLCFSWNTIEGFSTTAPFYSPELTLSAQNFSLNPRLYEDFGQIQCQSLTCEIRWSEEVSGHPDCSAHPLWGTRSWRRTTIRSDLSRRSVSSKVVFVLDVGSHRDALAGSCWSSFDTLYMHLRTLRWGCHDGEEYCTLDEWPEQIRPRLRTVHKNRPGYIAKVDKVAWTATIEFVTFRRAKNRSMEKRCMVNSQ